MRFHVLTALATLTATALANVKFTAPASGAQLPGGTAMTITWTDDGETPTLDQLKSYTLEVVAGGNTDGTWTAMSVAAAQPYSGTSGSQTVTIPLAFGKISTNGYYLRMTSVGVDGGQAITYSNRFGLTGMTGTFNAQQTTALASIKDFATVPKAQDNLVDAVATGATTAAAAIGGQPWTVPYHLQTGLVKYAPPQPIPGTKITAKSPSMMNPSTSYTIFSTYAKPATITYTSTATQTFSVSSRENTIAAASQATGDMNKYLNRWKD